MTPAILETALYAEDLDAAEAFYGGVLELEKIVRVKNRHVFFKLDQSVLLIFNPSETAEVDMSRPLPVPPHGASGPGHACFRAEGDALDAWEAKLKAFGVEIEQHITWPNGARSFYFRDPEGNSLEFGEGKLWELE
ncbi:MAG: VOC family protein [Pseudomonadota bacterium]